MISWWFLNEIWFASAEWYLLRGYRRLLSRYLRYNRLFISFVLVGRRNVMIEGCFLVDFAGLDVPIVLLLFFGVSWRGKKLRTILMVHVGGILHDGGKYWPHGSGLGGFGYLCCWYLVVLLVSYCSSSSIHWDVPPGWFWLWIFPMTWMSFCCWLIGEIDPCSLWSVSISCLVRSGSSILPLDVARYWGVLEIVYWVDVGCCCCRMCLVVLL